MFLFFFFLFPLLFESPPPPIGILSKDTSIEVDRFINIYEAVLEHTWQKYMDLIILTKLRGLLDEYFYDTILLKRF